MIYKRSLYPLALSVAKTQNLDEAHVADIHRQYGDYLYSSKSDYDGAMAQYIKTMGWIQPSYVIRKVRYSADVIVYKLTIPAVSGCSTDPQPCNLSTGTPYSRSCQLGSHYSPLEHLHKAKGCVKTGQLHQNRIQIVERGIESSGRTTFRLGHRDTGLQASRVFRARGISGEKV